MRERTAGRLVPSDGYQTCVVPRTAHRPHNGSVKSCRQPTPPPLTRPRTIGGSGMPADDEPLGRSPGRMVKASLAARLHPGLGNPSLGGHPTVGALAERVRGVGPRPVAGSLVAISHAAAGRGRSQDADAAQDAHGQEEDQRQAGAAAGATAGAGGVGAWQGGVGEATLGGGFTPTVASSSSGGVSSETIVATLTMGWVWSTARLEDQDLVGHRAAVARGSPRFQVTVPPLPSTSPPTRLPPSEALPGTYWRPGRTGSVITASVTGPSVRV